MRRSTLVYANEHQDWRFFAELALCPWANWTGTDAAVKMHTMLDLRGPLPSFVTITRGEQNEMAWLDEIPLEAGSKLDHAKRGFVLLPRRWVVECSFGWAARFRRLARDYERLSASLAGLHWVAFVCLMLKNFLSTGS